MLSSCAVFSHQVDGPLTNTQEEFDCNASVIGADRTCSIDFQSVSPLGGSQFRMRCGYRNEHRLEVYATCDADY